MYSNTVSIFNQFFSFTALLAVVLSAICYVQLEGRLSKIVRLSMVAASVCTLIISVLPKFALLLTISFVPAVFYHAVNQLQIAVLVAYPISFIVCFSMLVLLQELLSFFSRYGHPSSLQLVFVSMLIVAFMGHLLGNGLLTYKIIFNANDILNYVERGENARQLEKIYTAVALNHDGNMFKEMLIRLADNPHAPSHLLRVVYARSQSANLTEAQRIAIYSSISKNPHAPADLLKKLLVTTDQAASSRLPNLSADALLQLLNYPDCEIRRAIISYPNISESVLIKIIENDPDVGVKHDAKRRLDFLHGISHLDIEARSNTKSDNKIIAPAVTIADQAQLDIIYKNLDILDDADEVLASLAENCHISKAMARDIYAKAVLKKGYARTSVLIALANNPRTPGDILSNLANEKELAVLRALMANSHLPDEIISRFAPYPDCKIRKAIICLPAASITILTKLRRDADESVAQEAAERLHAENSYLDVCREFKKITPNCGGTQEDSTAAPDMRVYPNTSANPLYLPLAAN